MAADDKSPQENKPFSETVTETLDRLYDEAYNMGIDHAIEEVKRMAVLDVNNKSFYDKFSQYTFPYQSIIDNLGTLKKTNQ